MKICGLQKATLIDFPGKVACTVFLSGCNWRCVYCQNPDAVAGREAMSEDAFFAFLDARRGKLEGVVVSGGEPTIHPDLPRFLARIRKKGFAVKLDTNGSRPDMLARVLREGLVDYVAMDVKAPFHKYPALVQRDAPAENLRRSIALLLSSGVAHEFRTTAYASLEEEDFQAIAAQVAGARRYYLQRYRDGVTLMEDALPERYSRQDLEAIAKKLGGRLTRVGVRG